MRPLKFESCLSVPNELRLDKNVPRLRPDVADGATHSTDSSPDSAPTLPRRTSESSACIFLPSGPSEPRLSRLTRQRYEPPRTSPGSSRLCHESCRINLIRLDSGLGPDNFKLFKVFGASSRSAKNHQESSRLTTNLLRFTPNHPDSATTHPDSPRLTIRRYSAPDSGMCNWGFTAYTPFIIGRCDGHGKSDLCQFPHVWVS